MSAQQDLFGRAVETPQALAEFLRGRGWVLARRVLESTGARVCEGEKRRLRALAERAPDVLCGQRGYCHVDDAAPGEAEHCANFLVSQGKKMIARGLAVRRRARQAAEEAAA